jgi:hypothetical protein
MHDSLFILVHLFLSLFHLHYVFMILSLFFYYHQDLNFYLCVFLGCISVFVSISLQTPFLLSSISFSISLPISMYFTLHNFISINISFYPYVYLSFSIFLFLSPYVTLFVAISSTFNHSLFLSLSVFGFFFMSLLLSSFVASQ